MANVAFNNDNKVVSFGSSFVKLSKSSLYFVGRKNPHYEPTAKIASSTPSLSVTDAIAKAEELIDGQHNDHPPTLEFLALQDGSVALTHVIQIQNDETGAWVEAFIDAHTGELHSVTDFVAKASVSAVICLSSSIAEFVAAFAVPCSSYREGNPDPGLRDLDRPSGSHRIPTRMAQ